MTTLRNHVQLVGRIGQTVELRKVGNDRSLVRVSMATNDYYRNANNETVQETQWHTIVCWGKTADRFATDVHKGDEVLIQGKITYNNYTDKNGVERQATDIVVEQFLVIQATKKGEITTADLSEA